MGFRAGAGGAAGALEEELADAELAALAIFIKDMPISDFSDFSDLIWTAWRIIQRQLRKVRAAEEHEAIASAFIRLHPVQMPPVELCPGAASVAAVSGGL